MSIIWYAVISCPYGNRVFSIVNRTFLSSLIYYSSIKYLILYYNALSLQSVTLIEIMTFGRQLDGDFSGWLCDVYEKTSPKSLRDMSVIKHNYNIIFINSVYLWIVRGVLGIDPHWYLICYLIIILWCRL